MCPAFYVVYGTAGPDEVRTLGPNQASELVSPDSASRRPNFSSLHSSSLASALAFGCGTSGTASTYRAQDALIAL